MLLLAAALAVSLAACGKGPEADAPAPGGSLGGEKHKAEQTPDRSDTVQTVTYWTAVRQERYNAAYDRTETSAMPTEKWWADLYLNGDGTAQFREVLGQSCLFSLTGGAWQQEADGALRLTGLDPVGDSVTMEGRREADGAVTLEDPYGSRFYLEPAERPAPGGELCLADLSGTWRMTGLRTGDRTCGMEDLHAASLLTLHPRWSDLDGGRYVLKGEYYRADGLDTDAPEYRTVTELAAEYRAEPLTEGLANELWSAGLSREDSDAELLVTLTDRNTLYLREPGEGDGGTAVYTRSDSFLPEPLTEALAEEPGGALLFLWRDPRRRDGGGAGGPARDGAGGTRKEQAAGGGALVRDGAPVLHRRTAGKPGRHSGGLAHGGGGLRGRHPCRRAPVVLPHHPGGDSVAVPVHEAALGRDLVHLAPYGRGALPGQRTHLPAGDRIGPRARQRDKQKHTYRRPETADPTSKRKQKGGTSLWD